MPAVACPAGRGSSAAAAAPAPKSQRLGLDHRAGRQLPRHVPSAAGEPRIVPLAHPVPQHRRLSGRRGRLHLRGRSLQRPVAVAAAAAPPPAPLLPRSAPTSAAPGGSSHATSPEGPTNQASSPSLSRRQPGAPACAAAPAASAAPGGSSHATSPRGPTNHSSPPSLSRRQPAAPSAAAGAGCGAAWSGFPRATSCAAPCGGSSAPAPASLFAARRPPPAEGASSAGAGRVRLRRWRRRGQRRPARCAPLPACGTPRGAQKGSPQWQTRVPGSPRCWR